MSAIRRPAGNPAQNGSMLVEFGLLIWVFFILIFGIIELARLLYAFNTLQECTRRAASAVSVAVFGSTTNLQTIRRHALFRSNDGALPLIPNVTDQSVRIEFLWIKRGADGSFSKQTVATGSMPTSAAQNAANCLRDPYNENCVQLVQVRICDPKDSTGCTPIDFMPLTAVVPFKVPLPTAPTILKTQF